MYCLHPIEVRKYAELADGSKKRTCETRLVPCGTCVACLSRKRNEWTYRLTMEDKSSSYSYFLTLTYDDLNVPIFDHPELGIQFCFNKKHIQDYLKRVRYYLHELNSSLDITYYCISEYGSTTHRPHYHMLLFVKNDKYYKYNSVIAEVLRGNWSFGYSTVKATSPANIHYCTKYCMKGFCEDYPKDDSKEKPFVLCSKDSYLGKSAEDLLASQSDIARKDLGTFSRDQSVVFLNGQRLPMPRIYRDKLGLSGNSQPLSIDPRLSQEKYDKWKQSYIRAHNVFDEQDFQRYINARLYYFENNAIRRQNIKQRKF